MKKLIALAMILPLTALGCDWGKKKPAATPVSEPLAPTTPQVYTPSSTGGMGTGMSTDAGGGSTLTPIDLPPPTVTPTPVPTHSPVASSGGSRTIKPPVRSTGSKGTSGSSGSSVTGTRIGSTYTVKSGDSLSEIAEKAYGKGNIKKGVTAITKANSLKNNVIKIGQKLKIPAL